LAIPASYQAAVRASPSIHILPSSHVAFRELAAALALHRNEPRRPVRNADTLWFAAYPSLDADTLAFVPYPRSEVLAGRALPATQWSAVIQNRDMLRDIVTTWMRAFPDSPDLQETLALVLETTGELADARPTERSALATIRVARRLAQEPADDLRLAVTELRLLVKLGEFPAASRQADSLLRVWHQPSATDAAQLAGVAALTGRALLAAQLRALGAADFDVEASIGRRIPVRPLALAIPAAELEGYAALDAPADSVTALARRVDSLAQIWVPPARLQVMRDALLYRPRQWAFPRLGSRPAPAGIGMLQWALEQHDTAFIRGRFALLQAWRTPLRPDVDVAISNTYQEARVLLALGDSVAAIHVLDESLDALHRLGTGLLRWMEQAAGLVRAMVLRAELAAGRGDTETARRWARAVDTLWVNADNEELQEIVKRMRALVTQ
jgi:hypothetical protein